MIDAFHVHMLAHVGSEFVVLLFFEVGIALGALWGLLIHMLAQYVFDDGGIVEEAVYIGADAMVGLQDGLAGVADALVDLVALTCLTFELKCDLPGGFASSHGGMDRQQTESWQMLDVALDTFWVVDGLAQHLVTSADADDHLAVTMGTLDGLRTSVSAQFHEIVEGGLCARQDDDVGLTDIRCVVSIEEIDARVSFQGVEIGVVAEMAQQDDGNVDFSLCQLLALLLQTDAVLLVDKDVFIIRYHTKHRYPTDIFQHFPAFIKEPHVAPELIDDNAFDKLAVLWRLEHDAAINAGEDASAVYIAHQDNIGVSVASHRHVDQVPVLQVDLGNAACTLHHDGIVA